MSRWSKFTQLGRERRCSKCDEWWPDDAEFYYRSNGKSRQPCKACYAQLPSVIAKEERRKAALGRSS